MIFAKGMGLATSNAVLTSMLAMGVVGQLSLPYQCCFLFVFLPFPWCLQQLLHHHLEMATADSVNTSHVQHRTHTTSTSLTSRRWPCNFLPLFFGSGIRITQEDLFFNLPSAGCFFQRRGAILEAPCNFTYTKSVEAVFFISLMVASSGP